MGGTAAVDLVLVAVVCVALTRGPVTGMLAGSVAGLMQDALSSGVIGVGGLAKTVVGFLVGAIGQQFIVTAAVPRLVMFVAATAVHASCFMGLYQLLGARTFASPLAAVASQSLGNAVDGDGGLLGDRGAAGGVGATPGDASSPVVSGSCSSERLCR